MAKANDLPATDEKQTAGDVPVVSLTLPEFCTRLSATVRRPELIGSFEFTERTAGRSKATMQEFQSRFESFSNKPV